MCNSNICPSMSYTELALAKQLKYVAPFLADLKVDEFSESVKNNVLYALSAYWNGRQDELLDQDGHFYPVWKIKEAITWEVAGTRLHKRIKSVVYKAIKHNLPDHLLRQIADIAATERNLDQVWIDCTTEFDWDSGDYGDDHSCYWGEYENARLKHLPMLGASAIRSYETDYGNCGSGNGRGWIYPVPLFNVETRTLPIYVAFNPYGTFGDDHSLFQSAAKLICSMQHGKEFKSTQLFRHTLSGCYVNGYDYLIYPADLDLSTVLGEKAISDLLIDGTTTRYTVHVGWDMQDRVNCPLPRWARNGEGRRGCRCVSCGDRVDEDDAFYYNDDCYCSDCFSANFSYCEFCEEDYPVEDIHNVDGYWICENCRDRYCTHCDHCNEYHVSDRPRYHRDVEVTDFTEVESDGTNETWCWECYEDGAFYCEVCDTPYDTQYTDMVTIGHKCMCESCARERAEEEDAEEEDAEEEDAEEEVIDHSPNVLTGFILITDAKPCNIDWYGVKSYTYAVSDYHVVTYTLAPLFSMASEGTDRSYSPNYNVIQPLSEYTLDNIPF